MRKTSNILTIKVKSYKNVAKGIFKTVELYDKIAIYAHRSPDFDAFGSQFGLSSFLKTHYPHKEIIVLGETNENLNGSLYPKLDELPNDWNANFLALVVDTGNTDRISDSTFKKAKALIKIDHHPNVEPYGDYVFVDTTSVAVSEILTVLFLATNKKMTKETATYLFSGIVGDSGRFRYRTTSTLTFLVSAYLLAQGIDLTALYDQIYALDANELNVRAYILNNYEITADGFAYYILSAEKLKELGVSVEVAKEQVNIFSDFKNVYVWAAIVENKARKEWRVSLRSRGLSLSSFAAKWHGGGHPQASGASIREGETLNDFVTSINTFIRESRKD